MPRQKSTGSFALAHRQGAASPLGGKSSLNPEQAAAGKVSFADVGLNFPQSLQPENLLRGYSP